MDWTGYLSQPDDYRDEIYVRPDGIQLPDKVDLREGKGSLRFVQDEPYNQGYLSSCTACAIAAALQFGQNLKLFGASHGSYLPSRLFIYWCERVVGATRSPDSTDYPSGQQFAPDQYQILIDALNDHLGPNQIALKDTDVVKSVNGNQFSIQRILDGLHLQDFTAKGVSEDGGAYIRNGIKALKRVGVCPEFFWPYIPWDENWPDEIKTARTQAFISSSRPGDFVIPPTTATGILKDAANYINQDFEYVRIADLVEDETIVKSNTDLISDMEAALAEGYPIIFALRLPSGHPLPWPYTGPLTYDHLVRDNQASSGHAVLAVGYDRAEGGRFLVLNSYGPNWAENGYFHLPYSRFSKEEGTFGWKDGKRYGQTDDFWVLKAPKI